VVVGGGVSALVIAAVLRVRETLGSDEVAAAGDTNIRA